MNRLEFCCALARDAGRLAHTGFGHLGVKGVSMKGRHDVLTEMDARVERFIRDAIAARYPDDAVLGEEGGASGDANAEHLWIVDPIDGTANYARGIAHYCVSIGLMSHGELAAGALHDPSHERLYWAGRGTGAWLNGERLAVSPIADLHQATVECGWSTRRSTAEYLAMLQRVYDAGCAMRRAGSGALGLADVAAGRVEAYAEQHINSWDCAAGVLLVREAGGFTNDFFAGDGLNSGNALVATNAALAEPLARVVGIGPLI
ncbi:MAG TPA: inositol monophosphatase family protein [Burkholderiaceae bacterium]|nr:inositol monophosphatase family protein [Burkholderiaceae bacterium]